VLGQLSVTRRLASGHCGDQRALYKPDSNTNGYCHGDSNSHSQRHSYGYTRSDPYRYSYRDVYGNSNSNSNSPPAKEYTDAKAASHSVAETVVGLLETVL